MNKDHILIIGAGRIGSLVSLLLKKANYKVFLADTKPISKEILPLDINDKKSCEKVIKKNHITTIISCLPYYLTFSVFEIAQNQGLHYFDLTEDVSVSQKIKKSIKKSVTQAFVPHCGLAPGLVGILANELVSYFDSVESIQLRVGGIPQYAHNILHYAITWSVDGLINGYGNLCEAIEKGKRITVKPLEDIEELEIDGMLYEAFNTSGGIGNLISLYENKVNALSYKTIRYPGHAEKMRFLMNDLKLNDNRGILKDILENALPQTDQDVVIIDVSVLGKKQGKLQEKNIFKKYYPQKINKIIYSALQMTTAASLCSVIDVVLNHSQKYKGLIAQEMISWHDIQKSNFGKYL
jgi:saccharopine dehydrogenase-like NADP-dependent oxidoreductase